MRNARKTVIALTVENQTHNTSAKETVALEKITGRKEGKRYADRFRNCRKKTIEKYSNTRAQKVDRLGGLSRILGEEKYY